MATLHSLHYPSALTVRLVDRGSELTEIRRELVESIELRLIAQARLESLQVAITYRPMEAGADATKTVLLGLRLTVQPVNLFNALVAWKDSAHQNPSELLDRIERILRASQRAACDRVARSPKKPAAQRHSSAREV